MRTYQLVTDEFYELSEGNVRVEFVEVECQLGDDLCVRVRLKRVPLAFEKFGQAFEVRDDS